MIAALYVISDGVYAGRPDVDCWPEERDARKYDGPWPVVAHPPCERWGRYWSGGQSEKTRRKLGDDNGCFRAALASVRQHGGVIEHPEASHAWRAHGLTPPPKSGGWIPAGDGIGFTCCVEQGHYGHRARKATWLYAVRCELPELTWGPASGRIHLEQGFHSAGERAWARANGMIRPRARLRASKSQATPPAFAELMLSMARSVR